MEYNYKKGQKLILELKTKEIFEGLCNKCGRDRIDLYEARRYPDGKQFKTLPSFYRCEIVCIRVLNQSDALEETITSPSTSVSNGLDKDTNQVIQLFKSEYERLLGMTNKYIYMPTIDNRYLQAIDHLSNCETIGVAAIDSRCGRGRPLSLLVLCSWDQVYIFDLLLYRRKKFEPELKEILESKQIKKVLHDSRKVVDCLWHCYEVKLDNIFDTMVADLTLEKGQTGAIPSNTRNLTKCLEQYFNFPSSLLENALSVTKDEWEQRPIVPSRKIQAAQMAAFLPTLKEKQEKMLLKHFYDAVTVFSNLSVNSDGFALRNSSTSDTAVPDEVKELL